MMSETIEVRISRYLAGEAQGEEREAFEREMESDPALREQFLEYKRIWQLSHTEYPMQLDVEKAWGKFNSHIQANTEAVKLPMSRNRTRKLSWAVAAALVLALGAAVFFWMERQPVEFAYVHGQTDPLVLSDGSAIYLNENARVKVHSFKNKKRRVDLTGEAYFEIKPDVDRPFIVEAGGTMTEVVGTSFNISNSPGKTTIFVKSGKVIFRSESQKEVAVALTSGEAAVFQNDNIKRIINPSPNMHSWHSRELRFIKNMPFSDIIADIATYFGKEISFENEKVKNCRVTIPLSFKEPEFKSVLQAVVAPVSAEFVMEGDKCIIKGGVNCN
jgi:ferric-dicitrate binding protein FerR (iron transport regulator)